MNNITQEEVTIWEKNLSIEITSWIIEYFEGYKIVTFLLADKSKEIFKIIK